MATASNGAAALAMLGQQRFDLVVMDVNMPGLSGLDVLRSMKQRSGFTPPVLMVTANRNTDTVSEALALGCAGYLAKPFTPEGLTERVRKAMTDGGASVRVPLILNA